jgi:hypothetical protein
MDKICLIGMKSQLQTCLLLYKISVSFYIQPSLPHGRTQIQGYHQTFSVSFRGLGDQNGTMHMVSRSIYTSSEKKKGGQNGKFQGTRSNTNNQDKFNENSYPLPVTGCQGHVNGEPLTRIFTVESESDHILQPFRVPICQIKYLQGDRSTGKGSFGSLKYQLEHPMQMTT